MNTRFNWKQCLATVVVGCVGSVFGIDAPTGLSVESIDYTQAACNIDCTAKLSWTAPATGTPTGYKVYRRIAAHEQPTLAGTVEAGTTSFTDTTATVGQLYTYTVTAVDTDGESEESDAVSYRRLENVALASKGNTTLNNPELGNGVVANANDGALNNVVLNGNSAAHLLVVSFKDGRRPCLKHVRLNFGVWGDANKSQKFYGTVLRNGTAVSTEFDGSSSIVNHNFTQNAWNQFPVAASLQNDIWTSFTFGGGNWYGNCREVEAYGYLPSSLLGTPAVAAPVLGDAEALLSWEVAANAASYSVYRKVGDGAWAAIATGLTNCFYKDAGLTDGTTYTYRVAAVAANGDESSAADGVTCTAQAVVADIPVAYGVKAAAIDFTQAACNVDCSAQLSWSLVSAANFDKVRVYRFIKGHEDETPAPIATLDKATTTYTDTGAVVGQAYLYKVTCFDSATGAEGTLSDALAYIKLENVVLASKGNVTLNSPTLENGAVANVNDGNAANNAVCKDNSTDSLIVLTFKADRRPRLVHARLNFGEWGSGNKTQKFYGTVLRNGTAVSTEFNGSSTIGSHTFTQNAWNQFTVAASLLNDVWSTFTFGGGNWYGNCREVEAYGYVPGSAVYFSAPELSNPVAGRKAVSLSWAAAANVASYKVYRKAAEGDWVVALEGVTGTTASDTGATFDGTTYTYRVAAVAANGDELSSETKTVLCPAGAPFWWNFLNVKSVAFTGAAAYSNPSQVKPHYMSRDKAGTLLAVPMSTDNGTHPTVTFDFAALASADHLGEMSIAQSGMKQYGIATDFGGGISCWKGAAVSSALVVIGNGAAGSKIAVVERATGACVKYALLNASGVETSFTMDGGLDFDAAGDYLYTNDGTTKNKIVKWQVDTQAKTLKQMAEYVIDGFTRIRNFAIYTVGGNEYAFFGEGSAKTGKIGALKLADGSVTTIVTDATTIAGDIMNVKLAQADGDTYVVAQLDTAAVGIYYLTAATMTATLEKAIDAATMKALYGTVDGGQYRNFEMTADGRYALVMNNAGAATRLVVVGASERLLPDGAPVLTATSNYSNKFKPTLTWTEGEDVLAEKVRIFRAQVGKPGAIALADLELGVQTYVDTTAVAGVPYAYSVAYVHTVNGQPIVGTRSAEVEAMALLDLKTKKKNLYRTGTGGGDNTLANLFDDNLGTAHSNSGYGEQAAFSVSEPVQVLAARFAPTGWAASDTYPRADNLRIYGYRTAAGGNWYDNKVLIGTGPSSVRGSDWVDFTLNASATPEVGYDYVTFSSGSRDPYLNLQEIDVYGALPATRAAALEKAGEAARDDAPTAAAAKGHALAWTESGVCTAVRIFRARTKEGPFVEVARVAAGAGAFADATAVDGVTYYYQFAYETEFEGVAYVGTPSAVVVDYGKLLSENGVASKQYLRTTNPVIASDYQNGPDYLFDGNLNNSYNNDAHAQVGLAFRTPVVVKYARIHTLGWAASDTYPRADNIGIYGATEDWSGTSGNKISSMSGTVKIGSSPAKCRGETWFDCTLTDVESAWSYLVLYRYNWFGNLREVEFYGYPKTAIDAAKALVVWQVEDLAAAMSNAKAVLTWRNVNALATSISIERRVNGGEWTQLDELTADATSYVDGTAEVGRHNEYRVWSADATERVCQTVTVTPLLRDGDRDFVACCGSGSDTLFVDASGCLADQWFKATLTLPGTSAAELGFAGDVRIVASGTDPVNGTSVQVIRDISTGALSLFLKGPGYASGQTLPAAQAVPECDGIRLVRAGLVVTAFYHTSTAGWMQFASAAFEAAPFAGQTMFVGVGAHAAGVTETTPSTFNVGRFRLRRDSGLTILVR